MWCIWPVSGKWLGILRQHNDVHLQCLSGDSSYGYGIENTPFQTHLPTFSHGVTGGALLYSGLPHLVQLPVLVYCGSGNLKPLIAPVPLVIDYEPRPDS
jgi:hypothetical protein